jgi:rhodanese-related sulfurtransferase
MSLFTRLFGAPVATIRAQEVDTKLKVGRRPFILDVRQPDEFRHGHIPGAKLIPLGELSRRMQEVPKGREIVCICATGHRSVPAARKLAAAGYAASSMKNGMIAWKAAHLPISK